MKIEKISEVQIKIVLEESDLQEHDLKIAELANGTEKAHALFQEMMEQALEEFGFEVKNTPLLIEAIPLTADSIVIIVTKVTNTRDIEESFSQPPRSLSSGRFKTKDILENEHPSEKEKNQTEKVAVYSFENIDTAIEAAARIIAFFDGKSAVYKHLKRYFLVLENLDVAKKVSFENMESMIAEYGRKHVSNKFSKYYLLDHGEVIIQEDAVKILADMCI